MAPSVYVRVIGFRDDERHALTTLFKLSLGQSMAYGLWTPEVPVAPALFLIDLDACDADVELALTKQHPNAKMLRVGQARPGVPAPAFKRPLDWPMIAAAMDQMFSDTTDQTDDSTEFDQTVRVATAILPKPAPKVTLIIHPQREDRLYLRARLALAAYTEVDEAEQGALAIEMAKKRRYDLVIVSLDVTDVDGWSLVRSLVMLEPDIGSVLVISTDTSWHMREHAEHSGCRGVIEKPYDPLQFVELLEKL